MVEYKITEKFTQEVIDEFLSMSNDNRLTPENILESAKKKKSPLHNMFDWEDSLAGQKWRLHQARIIINEVKVKIDDKEYYAFENVIVSVPKEESKSGDCDVSAKREYKPVIEILSDEDLRRQVIKSALNHLEYWEKQNEKYSELSPIIKSAQKVRKDIDKKWQKKKQ